MPVASTEEVQPPWNGLPRFGWYSRNITTRQAITVNTARRSIRAYEEVNDVAPNGSFSRPDDSSGSGVARMYDDESARLFHDVTEQCVLSHRRQ